MAWIKKVSAGILLTIGLPITLMAVIGLLDPREEDKEGMMDALVIFGLPATGLGGWLIWSLNQDQKKSAQTRDQEREQLLLELLQQQEGQITPLQFATAAKIPFAEAQTYLEQKANEMNASCQITESGGMIYSFPP